MNKKTTEELVEERKRVSLHDFRSPLIPWEANLGAVIGLVSARVGNYVRKTPTGAGIPVFIFGTAAGFMAGYWFHNQLVSRRTKHDIQIQAYLETYPERFPELKKKVPKFGDAEVLSYWMPMRRAYGPDYK